MTEIEALKIFKPFIDEKCMEYKCDLYFGYEENFEALQVAINALEKQIPKKVILRHIRKYDGYDDGECPICEMSVSRDCDGDDVFCPDCGQKLDWSDEE